MLFDKTDKDSSGSIQFDEFVNMMIQRVGFNATPGVLLNVKRLHRAPGTDMKVSQLHSLPSTCTSTDRASHAVVDLAACMLTSPLTARCLHRTHPRPPT